MHVNNHSLVPLRQPCQNMTPSETGRNPLQIALRFGYLSNVSILGLRLEYPAKTCPTPGELYLTPILRCKWSFLPQTSWYIIKSADDLFEIPKHISQMLPSGPSVMSLPLMKEQFQLFSSSLVNLPPPPPHPTHTLSLSSPLHLVEITSQERIWFMSFILYSDFELWR